MQAVKDGIGIALGGQMPAEYFSAIFDTDEEAAARLAIYQATRALSDHAEPAH